MPSVDFKEIRATVSMSQVLKLLRFRPCEQSGDQVRGGCPVHTSSSGSRSFSANLTKNTYQCFKCGSKGNQLDLWAAATGTPTYEAAISLCEMLHVKIPFVQNSQTQSDRTVRHATAAEKRNT